MFLRTSTVSSRFTRSTGERDACRPCKRRLIGGEKRAQAFFDDVKVLEFPQSKVLEAEPMGGCFINANTPDELHALEESFLEG